MARSPLSKSLFAVALATGFLLLIPLIAMQFTSEVSWGAADFLLAGTLLFSAGAAAVVTIRHLKQPIHKAVAMAGIALGLATLWAELAVGIFH